MDTDLLVALVASSLPRSDVPRERILEALVDAEGDVPRAVAALADSSRQVARASDAPGPNPASLDAWLIRTTPSSPHTKAIAKTTGFSEKQHSGTRPPAKSLRRLPPLTLTTSELISANTPATLHPSILPAELACKLFYYLIDDAESWPRNSWYLFDKEVTSPHRTAFYVRSSLVCDESTGHGTSFWYNGRQMAAPKSFPPFLEEACRYIEPVVVREAQKRDRYPLEWNGHSVWSANVAAVNCYEGMREGVGYHADTLTYLGPQCTIASLSLGCERHFRLRETVSPEPDRLPRTFSISLPHNSLLIMHPPMQERFKHSIPSQTKLDVYRPLYPRGVGEEVGSYIHRINVTFRFYRPDFRDSTPMCLCGIPAVLRADLKAKATEQHPNDGQFIYFWQCEASKVNGGKGCLMWQRMDWRREGRGPMVSGT